MQLGLLLPYTRECTLQGGTVCRHLGWSLLPSTPLCCHKWRQWIVPDRTSYIPFRHLKCVPQLLPHGPGEL